MNALSALYSTTIGKKVVMAVTGSIMVFWVFAHMAGNLQVFLGAKVLDAYGHKIQALGPILWLMRGTMLACLLLHIWALIGLTKPTLDARKTGYEGGRVDQVTTFAAHMMRFSGLFVIVFVPLHLGDLTVGSTHPSFEHGAVYHNLTTLLSVPWRGGFYALVAIAVGLHMWHGTSSLFQTLGLNHERYNDTYKRLAVLMGVSVAVGNLLIVVSIMLGLVR